jgi:hypothetical protein
MAIGNGFKGLAQIGIWIDAVHLAGFNQGSHSSPSAAPFIMTGEESVLAIEGHCPFILPMSAKSGKFTIVGIRILA